MEKDIENCLQNLAKSKFRSRFALGAKDKAYLIEKGEEKIKQHAYDFVLARLAPALPKNDGKQTPMRGHPVFVAQHATATCCRGCLSKWYKIPEGRELSVSEIDFVVSLIMAWLAEH